MATTPDTHTLYAQPCGDARHGLWCDRCSKPARIETDLLIMSTDGLSPLGVFSMCTDCGLPGTLHRGD